MKHFLAVPALALFAATAMAQTDTTTGVATGTDAAAGSGETFGTNWSLSVGTTFFTDGENGTLRPIEELTSGWQSLPQEDRDMITADCQAFETAHGDAAAAGSTDTTGAAATDGTAGTTAGTDAGTTTTGTVDTGTADAGTADTSMTDTGTAAGRTDTSQPVGYDMAEMQAICDAVGQL